MESFIIPPGATPEDIALRRKLAAALAASSTDTSPVRHWTQGAARMANALRGVQEDWGASADEAKRSSMVSALLNGGASQPQADTIAPAAGGLAGALGGGQPDYGSAISSIESGGKYDALGPVTAKGDRAFGKYQVMGANIPSWSEAALGKALTPEQFVADPKAQDAVFKHRFGQYVQQTGNPQDAASMWFSGRPMAQAGNAKDQLGTTVPAYVEKFTKALGGSQAQPTMAGGDTSPGIDKARLMQAWPYMTASERQAASLLIKQEKDPLDQALKQTQLETARRGLAAPAPDNRPSAIREYEYAKSQGYEGDFTKWQNEGRKAGASSVNVDGGGTNKQIFDSVEKSAAAAQSAVQGLQSISEAKRAVQSGAIFGAGADARLGLQKVGAFLGVADPAKIVNTETFRSAIAPQVSAMMKATVGSTQISNADREFAEKAAGGSIALDQGTVTKLLDIMERANRAVIDTHRKRLDAVYPESGPYQRERSLFGIPDLPPPPAAPAPDEGGWNTVKPGVRVREIK